MDQRRARIREVGGVGVEAGVEAGMLVIRGRAFHLLRQPYGWGLVIGNWFIGVIHDRRPR